MSFIYQEDSLQNDPQWKKHEHNANMNMHSYHMKNFKPQCEAPRGTTVSDGYIMPPCSVDTDSMLRHGLIENPSLLNPEEIDKTGRHFNSMPSEYNQQCNFREISCSKQPEFKFWESTSASVNPQENFTVIEHQGISSRHWGRKSDNFYKNVDDIELKQLF